MSNLTLCKKCVLIHGQIPLIESRLTLIKRFTFIYEAVYLFKIKYDNDINSVFVCMLLALVLQLLLLLLLLLSHYIT